MRQDKTNTWIVIGVFFFHFVSSFANIFKVSRREYMRDLNNVQVGFQIPEQKVDVIQMSLCYKYKSVKSFQSFFFFLLNSV